MRRAEREAEVESQRHLNFMLKTKGEPVKGSGRRVTWSGSILKTSN